MTGYGRAEGIYKKRKYSVEVKSLNSRYFESSVKSPKHLIQKDFEFKEIVREKISRGKLYVIISMDNEAESLINYSLNPDALKPYVNMIKALRKSIGSKEKIKIEHILTFADIFANGEAANVDVEELVFIKSILNDALEDLIEMRKNEGKMLLEDITKRIDIIEKESVNFVNFSKDRILKERERINGLVNEILLDKSLISDNRVELEIALLAEKFDITEEITRLNSHIIYFRDFMHSNEYSGRRLNFLLQEMNREVNTIASKSMDANISQIATVLKEELEKIREQIQNVV